MSSNLALQIRTRVINTHNEQQQKGNQKQQNNKIGTEKFEELEQFATILRTPLKQILEC